MTVTTQALRRELRNITAQVSPDKKGCCWIDADGSYMCDGYNFKDEKAFIEYRKQQGYTMMYILSWTGVNVPDNKLVKDARLRAARLQGGK